MRTELSTKSQNTLPADDISKKKFVFSDTHTPDGKPKRLFKIFTDRWKSGIM